ncbi:homing endonuclease [Acinetobacter phage 133]|uniref:Putative Seg-like homing endonuclease GIY-YIG family n=1 Tax=Acinetobacter phage 133 TaxID=2919552 RepID=D9I660_9CAUD|nr:homing endonuclease [Acinetobacter phage 133]ADJ19441.1 putative Seg-like homing endonuclease GIY-YIG family [Acinetobacter phage 133]
MFYFTYKTTNIKNGNFYVGVHKTSNLYDNYLGSGKVLKTAIKKYGPENFHTEILKVHYNQEDMYKHEASIVTEEFLTRPDTYNVKLGGKGGFDYVNQTLSKEDRQARSEYASRRFQLKMQDPFFYMDWYTKMTEGRLRKKEK